uniref:Uncharacterized protein n=1 Tax=Leersia perrieri TaxID=77586 RepID=A0A0D9XHK6_9ORYZ
MADQSFLSYPAATDNRKDKRIVMRTSFLLDHPVLSIFITGLLVHGLARTLARRSLLSAILSCGTLHRK